MKLQLFPPVLFLFLSLLLFSCAAEDLGETQLENITAINLAIIDVEDLEGRWNLQSMISNVQVDFNDKDKDAHYDIMTETDCFKEMFYEFNANGIVTARQSKLSFDVTGITSCESGVYSTPYSLKDDMLTISFLHKGELIPATKQINLSANKQTLTIEFTRLESSTYIKNDSGSSTAPIENIKMVYKKA